MFLSETQGDPEMSARLSASDASTREAPLYKPSSFPIPECGSWSVPRRGNSVHLWRFVFSLCCCVFLLLLMSWWLTFFMCAIHVSWSVQLTHKNKQKLWLVLIFLSEKSLHYDRTLVFVLPLAQVLCCCVSQNKIHVSQCLNKDFGVLLIWPWSFVKESLPISVQHSEAVRKLPTLVAQRSVTLCCQVCTKREDPRRRWSCPHSQPVQEGQEDSLPQP